MKKTLIAALFTSISCFVQAQNFLPPIERFSGSKPGWLVTNSGERVDFTLDDLDRKRGLIIKVEGKTTDGKKFKYQAEDIKELALAPADAAKLGTFMNSSQSVLKASKTDYNKISREHVLFYQAYVEDRKRTALLQLVNPGFESKIKVFDDPWATETMGVGIGGIQLTGGMDKSFYITYKDKTYKIHKRNYEELYSTFFGGCPEMKNQFKNPNWRDFAEHLGFFDQTCK